MTIQKINVPYGGKVYDVILEDGQVSYIDPQEPGRLKQLNQTPGMKVTSLVDAKRMMLQKIRKEYRPGMSFSD